MHRRDQALYESVIPVDVLWAFNLLTLEWRRYRFLNQAPSGLASFSLVPIEPHHSDVLFFGGSGPRFGRTSSNDLYRLCAFAYGGKPGSYYVVGGSDGINFDMEIYSLQYQISEENPKCSWKWKHLNKDMVPFLFLEAFDLEKNLNKRAICNGNENGEYPLPRKCHSLSRFGRDVIICGGVHSTETGRQKILDDVWILNLDTMTWRKYPFKLKVPVFFHDSAITSDGCLLVFGGVLDEKNWTRTNVLQHAFICPPKMERWAMFEYLHQRIHKLSWTQKFDLQYSTSFPIFIMKFLEQETDELINERLNDIFNRGIQIKLQMDYPVRLNRNHLFKVKLKIPFVINRLSDFSIEAAFLEANVPSEQVREEIEKLDEIWNIVVFNTIGHFRDLREFGRNAQAPDQDRNRHDGFDNFIGDEPPPPPQ
ncbi:unnamed protein product [Caenorhabditis bovis]|uniref:Kelch domain-containing protein 10 n=1 Tax=Caenorhabditis bovis TaxID=2654633 RepID=A0A8S1FCH3_9PELO|nr:unnamed protein product [Caenorhabditis bovis]